MENDKIFTLIKAEKKDKPITIKQKGLYLENGCPHRQIEVDKDLWLLKCLDCGAALDPVAFIVRLAGEESMAEYRVDNLRKEYLRMMEVLETKSKTKCQHCGKITTVNTEGDIKKQGILLKYVSPEKNRALNNQCKKPINCLSGTRNGIYQGHEDHEFYHLRQDHDRNNLYVCRFCGFSMWGK